MWRIWFSLLSHTGLAMQSFYWGCWLALPRQNRANATGTQDADVAIKSCPACGTALMQKQTSGSSVRWLNCPRCSVSVIVNPAAAAPVSSPLPTAREVSFLRKDM